eukprot:scaffold22614_cov94-Isochrysis_galbana.AAC.4
MGSHAGGVSVEWASRGVLESLALSGSGDVLGSLRDLLCGELMCLACRHSCGCQCSSGFWVAAGPEPMSSFDCWCLAPKSTLTQAPLDNADRETPERSGF